MENERQTGTILGCIRVILGLYRGYIGKFKVCTIVYWGYIRIMEKKMETTIGLRV